MKPMATMNVIPFIDIMLVLLAVVLTTTTFVAQGRIPVRLPEAPGAAALPPEPAHEITVSADGTLHFDDVPLALAALATRVATLGPADRVRLRVDAAAAFGHFVAVVDLLKAQGVPDVSIVTVPGGA